MKKVIKIDYSEDEGLDKYELSGTVTIKRLSFSEKNSMEEESTDIKMFGNVPQIKVSTSKIKELGILKSVVESSLIKTVYQEDRITKNATPISTPYNLDLEGIKNLPQDVGEQLIEAFTDINTVNEKKKIKIKRKIEGMHINDDEVDKSFVYFLCAYYFHWTIEQTDKVDMYTLDTLLTMLPLWRQKMQEGLSNE